MEQLADWSASQDEWTLETDRLLLKAIQDMSGDILASIQRIDTSLSDLHSSVRTLSLRTGHAAASFTELCQTQFIQQDIGSAEQVQQRKQIRDTAQSLANASHTEIEESKYKEAIELASKAFSEDSVQSQEWKPLPHIFGSPEYLQDATFGIGEPSLPDSETSIDEEEARDTLSPLPGEAVPEVEDEIDGEDILMDAYVPDFRSMLEAALRGEFDDGLDDLAGSTEEADLESTSRVTAGEYAPDHSNQHLEHRAMPSGGEMGDKTGSSGPQQSNALQQPAGYRGDTGQVGQSIHDIGPSELGDEESPPSGNSPLGQGLGSWDDSMAREHNKWERGSPGRAAEDNKASLQRLLEGQDDLFDSSE